MSRKEHQMWQQHLSVVEGLLGDCAEDIRSGVLAQIRFLAENLSLHQTELRAQNEALRTSQAALEAARDNYLALYHHAPVGYLILDEAGIILHANQTFADMVAAAPETLPRQAFHSHLEGDSRQRFLSRYRQLFKSPRAGSMDVVLTRAGGQTFHGHLEMRREKIPWSVDMGRGGGESLLLTVMDVSEARRAEAALQESEDRFRMLIEQASDAVYLTDGALRFVMVNRQACRMLGYTRAEFAALGVLDIQKAYDPAELRRVLNRLASGETRQVEGRHCRKDGTFVDVEISIVRHDTGGEPFFMAIARDITARKAVEAEKEQLIASLQQSLSEIRTLRGLIPICAHCKKIRDDEGLWNRIEAYVTEHSHAEFSHGICPDCVKAHYGDLLGGEAGS